MKLEAYYQMNIRCPLDVAQKVNDCAENEGKAMSAKAAEILAEWAKKQK